MTLQLPQVLTRDSGEHFHFLNNIFTTKVDGNQSGGVLTAMEFRGTRGFGPPLHRHDVEDELFYVAEGEVRFVCGEVDETLEPGGTAWLPKGIPHQFQILSDEARVFQVTTPAQFERLVARLGAPATTPTIPEPTEIDPELVARICAEFQIELLGPPPPPLD